MGTHWISTEHWAPGYHINWAPKNTSGKKKIKKPVYYEWARFIFRLSFDNLQLLIFEFQNEMVDKYF